MSLKSNNLRLLLIIINNKFDFNELQRMVAFGRENDRPISYCTLFYNLDKKEFCLQPERRTLKSTPNCSYQNL